jgi:hypothetical protein
VEAFGILSARPLDNRQQPRPGGHTWFFTQVLSEHADPTQHDMVAALYEKLVLGSKPAERD